MKSTILFSIVFLFFSVTVFGKNQWNSEGKLSKETLIWQDIKRSYLIYVPKNYDSSNPVPLLFHLHGGGGTGKGTIKLTFGKFNQLADEKNFIAVYPNAIKRNWNDGRLANLKPGMEFVDDVGFITAIVEKIKSQYRIDMQKIFVTGMSNGGFMTSRLLCDKSEIFRGGAILTATLSVDYINKCKPTVPVGVMIINGTEDPLVPYNGGHVMVLNKSRGAIVATDVLVDFWKNQLNCDNKKTQILPNKDPNDGSVVEMLQFETCKEKSSLVLYKIIDGGHTWPGGKQYLSKKIIGTTNRDFNACEIIWSFFDNLPNR